MYDYLNFGHKQIRYGGCFVDAKCSVCGKEFLRSPEWVYKHGDSWQCSYTCYRVLDRVERKKYKEALDNTLDSICRSTQSRKERQREYERNKRQSVEYRLNVALQQEKRCREWIIEYKKRLVVAVNQTERRNTQKCIRSWKAKLEAAQQAVANLKKEAKEKENVRTPEEEAIV